MRFRAAFSLFVTVLVTGACVAAAPTAHRRAPEMDQLKRFLGSWDCKGTIFAFQDSPTRPTHNLFEYKEDLDGAWISMRGHEQSLPDSASHTAWMRGGQVFGYDRSTQKFLIFGFDASGGWWLQRSDPPVDGKFVFRKERATRSVTGQMIDSRDTYHFESDTRFHHVGEISADGGQWRPVIEQTCERETKS